MNPHFLGALHAAGLTMKAGSCKKRIKGLQIPYDPL